MIRGVSRMLHSEVDIFKELAKPCYAELTRTFRTRRFAKKAAMFMPRQESDAVFIVSRGRARVYLAYEDKEFTLALLEPGDVYSTHTRAYVTAMEETDIVLADTVVFRRYMLREPELTRPMVKVLGKLLKHSISIIDKLAFKDVKKRLKEFLNFEARRSGTAGEGGVTLDLGLTTEQLAAIIGTTRQTLSTLLNDMAKRGIIEIRNRGVLFVPDIGALA